MGESRALSEKLTQSRLLVRGESLIGSVGIAIAAILLVMVALAGWWSMRGQQEAWRFVRSEQIRVLSSVISQSAESMLAGSDLSALRRLIIDSRQQHGLNEIRITLPDGKVIADAEPSKITLVNIPPSWPSGPLDAGSEQPTGGADTIAIHQPLLIKGRGSAMLTIIAPTTSSAARLWETAAGIGLIGAGGLAAMLIVYRRMRTRVAALGLIRDSLMATQESASGTIRSSLTLRTDLGPEAAAWNTLIEENESLRKTNVAERVKETLGNRREGRGDLEHAFDAMSMGMIVVDEKALIKHANGAAAVMLQSKRDQILGQDISTVINDVEVKKVIDAMFAGSGQRRTMEISRPPESGGGVMRMHIRPMRRDDAGGVLITIEDITQQRAADAARNSFVAQATHELRTPLTNMRLCLEDAIDDQESDPSTLREHINTLNLETRRLERMVGEMLSVAQIEAGSLSLSNDDIRLDKVFEELQHDYKKQAIEKSITLTFDLPPKFPVVLGDRDKLMITLHNMIGNALKYTPAKGTVIVAVRADASRLVVDVTDTGIGINPDEQQKIFEKFYRAKDPRVDKITGTGLGLALAREIARLHNGDIIVSSELNKGSTFSLNLPVSPQAKAA